MAVRRKVPVHVRELVLLESGYMCANPVCRTILALDLHHVEHVRDEGGNEPGNLLVLCPNCHALHHRGVIPVSALRVWKGMLAALNAANRANVDLLLQVHRMAKDPFLRSINFSGDVLLTLSGLFSAGLVAMESGRSSSSGPATLTIGLTERGVALVEAWLAGDEEKYLEAQRQMSGERS